MEISRPSFKQSNQGGLTLQEIANILDLTKESVRQIEVKALTKLRRKLLAARLDPTDLYEG